MRQGKRMTLEDHYEMAEHLAAAEYHLRWMYSKCLNHYLLSDKLIKTLERLIHTGRILSKLLVRLEDSYFNFTQFNGLPYTTIYVETSKRYNDSQQKVH